jgi:hypothetical protein
MSEIAIREQNEQESTKQDDNRDKQDNIVFENHIKTLFMNGKQE